MNFTRRLMLSMLMVMLIACGATAFIGGFLLWQQWKTQAENLAWQDLGAAGNTYNQTLEMIRASLRFTVLGERFSQAVEHGELSYLASRLDLVAKTAKLDFLLVTDNSGVVLYRAHNPEYAGDNYSRFPLVERAFSDKPNRSGSVLLPVDVYKKESPASFEESSIESQTSSNSNDCGKLEYVLFLMASEVIHTTGDKAAGVLLGGISLHGRADIFEARSNEENKSAVTCRTIFLGKTRVTTTARTDINKEVHGICLGQDVYDHVVKDGMAWLGKSKVGGADYIAAYRPLSDINGKNIGVLGVGVPEYAQKRIIFEILLLFGAVSLSAVLIAWLAGWRLSRHIYRPLQKLVVLTEAIGQGDFNHETTIRNDDEFKRLHHSFERMIQSLRNRDEQLKKHTRQQLTQSERLASIGRLAAGVAHEINNPLTGVLTFSHLLRREVPDKSRQAEDLETIIDATTRCKQIVRGLLDFSRQSEPEKSLVDIGDTIRNAINLMSNQAKINRVSIEADLDESSPKIVVDGSQIHDVFVNLIVNAIDAMPEGGSLLVSTRRIKEGIEDWFEATIRDTGTGISEDDMKHIFDPFYTTKPTGKGTGLGLAIVYGIISEHEGSIEVQSKIDEGTAFTIRLPFGSEVATHVETTANIGSR